MALSTHPGGAADKAGLFHEALWGVRAMRYVLEGEASAIRIETPGDDGAEFYLQRGDVREHWQAKRQVTGQDTWSFQRLKSEGVLAFFFEKFRLGERCVFASISDAPELAQLTQNAAATPSFVEFKEHFLNKKRSEQFAELRNHLGSPTEEEVFRFLCSVSVHGGRENTLEPEFGFPLGAMFQGSWQNTMAVLRDLYLRSSHETLTAADIERYLLSCGITRRRADAPDTRERVVAVTRGYVAGQRAKLIRGTPIRRAVADDVVTKIQTNSAPLDILITSAAGGGKSACLCQIVEGLQAAGVPVLAFRLDRVEPVASAILLGEKLGLGESPAVVLADAYPGQSVVLVVDQIDCVSTTSGRHPDFFDTIAALRDEILGLRPRSRIYLVLACRKFDFEHDHRLKQLITKDQAPMELGEFTNDEVKAVLASEGGDFSTLTPQQQTMLRLPQNLSLFVDARLAQNDNRFSTQKELCDAYWTAKRKAVALERPEFDQLWLPAIQHLASTMSERQELSVPKTAMDQFPPEFLDRMASEGVLTWDERRYGFGHETFFDYCFARTQPNGGRDFIRFLESDTQHLFRRAQLRQVLAFLRDDEYPAYIESVCHLLRSDRIRSHLKLLTVELVAAQPEAGDEELNALMPWIDSELACRRAEQPNLDKLASRIWERLFSSRTLFIAADRMGFVHRWLHSGEAWLENSMAHYLRWQMEDHGDRVTELLEPFVGQGGEWRNRLRFMMEGRNLDKSRRVFDLFLRLLDDGTLDDAKDRFASNGTFWSMLYGLAEKRPAWCAELAARWLDRRLAQVRASSDELECPWALLNDQFGVDDLFKSARGSPLAFLEHVLPAILRIATAFAYGEDPEEFRRDRVWPSRYVGRHIGLSEAYLGACEAALELVGQQSPEALRPFISQLRSHSLYTANHLLLFAYLSNPAVFADEAVRILADEPKRLSCGYSDNSYWRSRQIIEKCSSHCSEEAFRALEAVLGAFVPPYERTKEGRRLRGHASYNLASALAEERRGTFAKARLAELQGKFKRPDGPPQGIRSYTVVSPIEEEAAQHMTDEQWLRAIAKYDTEERTYNFEHPERGGAWELAGMLQKFAKEQPERFARLALQFPDDSEPSYFSNILRGLKETAIPSEMKLAVARRVFGLGHHDCLCTALDLLRSLTDIELPDDAIHLIKRSAEHSDPVAEIWDGERPFYGGCILTHGINTVRGHAAEAVRDLVFDNSRYLVIFSETIERLTADPSLSVRSCVATSIAAVARHDAPLALRLMGRLLDTDDRLLSTAYVVDFIQRGLREHFDYFAPTIERMLRSEHEKVRKEGGIIACLARLYHERADSLSEAALSGDEHCRLGACEVAKSNLLYPECRAWCEAALLRLFADEDETVRSNAAGCFWHLWHSPDTPLTEFESLIRNFLASPAFADEPTYLLHALEDTRRRVPEVLLDVCEIFINRCGEGARDIRTSLAGDELTVGKLVFTAYAQLQAHAMQTRALDVIDRMSLEGLSSASTHLSEFER